VFRREFGRMPDLIRGVLNGDRDRARVIADWISDLTKALHHHHSGEDDLLWPVLLQRVNLQSELIHQMESQHEQLSALLDRAEELLSEWTVDAKTAAGTALADVLEQASTLLDVHLAEEETEILPLVSEYLTPAEWAALGKRGQESLPKNSKAFVFLGAILQDASESEQAAFLQMLPAPIRLSWRLFGGRVYERAMARLQGT
jgi:hemerythrin-like domain-containing protein